MQILYWAAAAAFRAFAAAALCCLTFELRGRQRWDARPGLAKMYRVPPGRAWWPAVGAPFERGVRPHRGRSELIVWLLCYQVRDLYLLAADGTRFAAPMRLAISLASSLVSSLYARSVIDFAPVPSP